MASNEVSNRTAEFGACPYSDGSGDRFQVEANENNGAPYFYIKQHSDNWVRVDPSEWPALKAAIERAIIFLGGQP